MTTKTKKIDSEGIRENGKKIYTILNRKYKGRTTDLIFDNPFELLCAVILSAQCTDKRVNIVTPFLFSKYPNAYMLSVAKLTDVEQIIKSTGFYHNKASMLINMAKSLNRNFNGEVPKTLKELESLAGVGRKTANVILGEVYNIPAITVDTHVSRLSKRIGFTKNTDPNKIENDLQKVFDSKHWIGISRQLIFFGREICSSRKPLCNKCPISAYCKKIIH